jgi:hypothetical protein
LIGFIATSTTSIPELIAWARGYVGDERWGGKLGLDSVSTGWVTATNAWVGSRPAADSSRLFRGLLIAALIYAPFAGVRRIGQRGFERRTLFEAALLQCAISAMLIVWWEPRHMRFWMLLWVPYGVAVACSWADSRIPHSQKTPGPRRRNAEPARRLALFLLGVAVLGFNLRNGIIRESRPDERLETALASWRVHSEPGDTLIPTDELVPHLLFRGDRPRTVNLDALLAADPDSSDRFARLRTAIDEAHCAGHTVLVAAGAGTDVLVWRADTLPISAAELDAFFAGFERSEAFRYGDAKTGEAGVVHRLMAADDDSCQR